MVQIGQLLLNDFPLLLAPMEDVSDPPFRALCKEQLCDLMYTEFVSVEGLIRDAGKSHKKIELYEDERPMGIQVFGAEIDSMLKAIPMIEAAKPDLLDINFGCPVKKVVSKGCGAALLQDVPKMIEMTRKLVESTNLPVTVKTRLGWNEQTKNIVDVAERLQDVGIKAISIHARTRSQLYQGNADWTLVGEVKNNPRMHIPVFGNGDIDSPQKALEYKNRYGVDGIMIGRAAIGNPWIFRQVKHYCETGELLPEPSIAERIRVIRKHLDESVAWKGTRTGIMEMRKHYARYLRGFEGIKSFRMALSTEQDLDAIYRILNAVIEQYSESEFQHTTQ